MKRGRCAVSATRVVVMGGGHHTMKQTTHLVLATFVVIALAGLPAEATTRQVCSSGCAYASIQAAVNAANAGDTIMLLDALHTEGGIVVGTDLTIMGDQLNPPVIQAATAPGIAVDRVLEIQPNADVVLQDLVIRHGHPVIDGGGGILNAGDLRLLRTEIVSNDGNGGPGGGIFSTGPLELEDSLVSGNAADLLGGGISCEGLCTLHMIRSTLDGNVVRTTTSDEGGGGLHNLGSALLEGSLVTGNVSVGSFLDEGGGVFSPGGSLVLVDTDVTGNQAGSGGGISSGALLTIIRGSVSDNSATSSSRGGGGVLIEGLSAILESTVITGNSSNLEAAGVWTTSSKLRIRRTAIADNVAAAAGGGLCVVDGLTILEDSLVADNTATKGGGAIVGSSATLRVRNSTVSGNTAETQGGGLWVSFLVGTLSLSNVTVTGNTADPDGLTDTAGGGLYVQVTPDYQGIVDVRNSIIAGNFDPGSPPYFIAPDCSGPITVDGWLSLGTPGLILQDPACWISGATPDIGGNQGLLPLADNGGPTLTHALDIGSPNLDAGDSSGCKNEAGAWLTHDQRGGSRFDTCDRGAYEDQAALPVFADDFEAGGSWLWDVTAN